MPRDILDEISQYLGICGSISDLARDVVGNPVDKTTGCLGISLSTRDTHT